MATEETETVVLEVLKPVDGWRDGSLYDGWNEYNDLVKRVFAGFTAEVPYPVLRSIVELIREIPKRVGLPPEYVEDPALWTERIDAVLSILEVCEGAGTDQAQMAAQMVVAYPNQASIGALLADAHKIHENPSGKFSQTGYAWDWN